MYREDYQMRMLGINEIEGILPVRGRGMDGSSCYDYDVSGKISLKAMYERGKIKGRDIHSFLTRLTKVMQETEKYLLNVHCLLMAPEYIFFEDEQFYFCYYPPSDKDFWKEFHLLTEYFVKQADYEDKECVRMTMLLHKETMKENYDLGKLVEECLQKKEEEPEEALKSEEEDLLWTPSKESGSGDVVGEETNHKWPQMPHFLNRNKKPKWGDWDGLHIEEEDLS